MEPVAERQAERGTMADRLDLVCLGEPLLELNQQVGDASGGRLFREGHGGDASNVAIAAARQGARVGFLSAVGDDPAGESFLALWRQEGVDASAVEVDPRRPTGLYFVSHDAGGHHFSYRRAGSAASLYTLDTRAHELIARASIVFASGIGLALSGTAADTVLAAMTLGRASGGRVAFDTNYRPKLWPPARAAALIEHAMRGADIALPGLEDAGLLLGLTDPDAIVDLCLSLGPTLVVLKMGAAGCLLATPERREIVAAFPCRPVDATGAGDTFCGSFLAEIARGSSPREAARYAACAAALSTAGYGAVPPIPRRDAVLRALAMS